MTFRTYSFTLIRTPEWAEGMLTAHTGSNQCLRSTFLTKLNDSKYEFEYARMPYFGNIFYDPEDELVVAEMQILGRFGSISMSGYHIAHSPSI